MRFSALEGGIKILGVPRATKPERQKSVTGDFERAAVGENWRDFRFSINFPSFSPKRAATGWLRACYLVFFAALGYRFVLRPELNIVRDKIRHPEQEEPATFRITRPERATEPMLLRIDSPDVFRSYAMFYDRFIVFLPRFNDRDFYGRLAQRPDTTANVSGIQYPWPIAGPSFAHDKVVSD